MATPMTSMMYPSPLISTPAPPNMMYRSYFAPETIASANPMNVIPQASSAQINQTQSHATTASNCFDSIRPSSRATSVKAEPGSTMAMSESSKKVFLYQKVKNNI